MERDSIRQEILVVNFFRTTNGELHCRVRDARTAEQWIVPDAQDIQAHLRRAAPRTFFPFNRRRYGGS